MTTNSHWRPTKTEYDKLVLGSYSDSNLSNVARETRSEWNYVNTRGNKLERRHWWWWYGNIYEQYAEPWTGLKLKSVLRRKLSLARESYQSINWIRFQEFGTIATWDEQRADPMMIERRGNWFSLPWNEFWPKVKCSRVAASEEYKKYKKIYQ